MNKATMAFGTGLLFVLIALTSACSSGEPGPVPMNLEIVGPLALELGISEEQVMDAMADASMEGGMTVWDMRKRGRQERWNSRQCRMRVNARRVSGVGGDRHRNRN